MVKTLIKNNKKTLVIMGCIIVAYILLFFSKFTYSKSWVLNNNTEAFPSISIGKGEYDLTVEYSSQVQVYLEGYIITKGQDFVIDGFLLDAAENGRVVQKLTIPYDIKADDFDFRAVTLMGEPAGIQSVSIKYSGTPVYEIFALVVLLSLFTHTLLKTDEKESWKVALFIGASFFVYHGGFINTPWFMLCYAGLTAAYIINLIKHKKEIQQFLLFYFILMIVMCAFSTVSPLFTRKMNADTSIFYSLAQGVSNGRVMYRDVFDQKGPVLYFMYVLAYWLDKGGTAGIYFIEVLFLTVAVFYTFKLAARYVREEIAAVISFASFLVFFNWTYVSPGTELEQWFMGILIMCMYYLVSDDNRLITYFAEGIALSIVFYSKFNIAVAMALLISMRFVRGFVKKKYKEMWCSALACAGAFILVTVLVGIYFIANNAIGELVDAYILFNYKYASSGGSTIARIIPRLFEFYSATKGTFFLTLFGIMILVVSKKSADIYAKVGIVLGYFLTVYFSLMSENVYPYYFCIVATYAILGVVAIGCLLGDRFDKKIDYRTFAISASVFFSIAVFSVNDVILQSDLVDKEPKYQDIMAHEMKLRTKSDGDFIYWDCLALGVFPAADKAPAYKYYFTLNISRDRAPEMYEEMGRYLLDGGPEFIIAERYRNDSFLEGDIVGKYDFVKMYEKKDNTGKVYMLYQRRQNE